MMLNEVRALMEQRWREIETDATAHRDNHLVLPKLAEVYRGLSSAELRWADEVIASWVSSSDPTKRFDALALIDHLGIRSAMGALKKLEARLTDSPAHDAPYQLEDLRKIMARLGLD